MNDGDSTEEFKKRWQAVGGTAALGYAAAALWKRYKTFAVAGGFGLAVAGASAWLIVGPAFVGDGGSFSKIRSRLRGESATLADEFRRQREHQQAAGFAAAPAAPALEASASGLAQGAASSAGSIRVVGGRELYQAAPAAAGASANSAALAPAGRTSYTPTEAPRAEAGRGGADEDGMMPREPVARAPAGGRLAPTSGLGSSAAGGAAPGNANPASLGRPGAQTGSAGAAFPKLDLSKTLTPFSQSGKVSVSQLTAAPAAGPAGSQSGATTQARFSLAGSGSTGGGGAGPAGGGSVGASGGGSSGGGSPGGLQPESGPARGGANPRGGGSSGGGGKEPTKAPDSDTTKLTEDAKKCEQTNAQYADQERAARDRMRRAADALAAAECRPSCNFSTEDWCRRSCPGAGLGCVVCRCAVLACNMRRTCEEAERVQCARTRACPLTAKESCSMDCVR